MKATLLGYPAYGRQYANQEDMQAAFLSGKDFSTSFRGGPYFSIRDFTETSICSLFDRVTLVQINPKPSFGILCAVTILRSEMCERKAQDEIKASTTGSPVASPDGAGIYRGLPDSLKDSLQSVKPDGSCAPGKGQDD